MLRGHSCGGADIACVTEQIAAKIRPVYLDVFVLENGKALFDYRTDEPLERMETRSGR